MDLATGCVVSTNKNVIAVAGNFTLGGLPRVLSEIHKVVEQKGYRDFVLDFAACAKAWPGPMLGVSARCQQCWSEGVEVGLVFPSDPELGRLFVNANWAHLIDPHDYEASPVRSNIHLPARKFVSAEQQYEAVNFIIDLILGSVRELARSDLAAIEWSVNEITDNVLNHAQSPVGGFVQLTNQRTKKRITFAVADSGVGIPNTLRQANKKLLTDQEALDKAIREGVTRDQSIGQGNGLYGSWRICEMSGGRFEIYSNRAKLISDQNRGVRITKESVPLVGTLVVATIEYAKPVDLQRALVIRGQPYQPNDVVDLKYAPNAEGHVILNVLTESATRGLGTRQAGAFLRSKIENLLEYQPNCGVSLDFVDIPIISSSFADEVLGKLFVSLGPLAFMARVKVVNAVDVVEGLINRAIVQRMKAGGE